LIIWHIRFRRFRGLKICGLHSAEKRHILSFFIGAFDSDGAGLVHFLHLFRDPYRGLFTTYQDSSLSASQLSSELTLSMVSGWGTRITHFAHTMDLSGIADAFLARSIGGLFWFEWRWSTYLIALPLSVSGRKDSCSVRERLCILESYEKIGCTTLKCRSRSALVQILIPET
jgi:hypothetical protein